MQRFIFAWLLMMGGSLECTGGTLLPLPARRESASGGRALAVQTQDLPLAEREAVWEREILSGNVPAFLRQGVAVTLQLDGHQLVIQATPDYLAIGTGDDSLRTPLTPSTASRIADHFGCSLPTLAMVDAIHRAAPLKMTPSPRPPRPDMTSVAAFLSWQENTSLSRREALTSFPWGTLTAGHQKDVVRLTGSGFPSGKVAIYGWHRLDGSVIQPLYTGHAETWVDYSHGIRLIGKKVMLDGHATTLDGVLTHPETSGLLSGYQAYHPPPLAKP